MGGALGPARVVVWGEGWSKAFAGLQQKSAGCATENGPHLTTGHRMMMNPGARL